MRVRAGLRTGPNSGSRADHLLSVMALSRAIAKAGGNVNGLGHAVGN